MKFDISRWCGEKADTLNLSGTVNLAYNGSVFVKEGLGYLLMFDHLVNTKPYKRPLFPAIGSAFGNENVRDLEEVSGVLANC